MEWIGMNGWVDRRIWLYGWMEKKEMAGGQVGGWMDGWLAKRMKRQMGIGKLIDGIMLVEW